MSLDFDYREVKNFKENFPDDGEFLSFKFQAIVWNMMAVSLREITEENADEVWWRTDFYQRVSNNGGKITEQDIRNAIGLSTNVADYSRKMFTSWVIDRFNMSWHTRDSEK